MIAFWLSSSNSRRSPRCNLYKHPSWGRHHSLHEVFKLSRETAPSTTDLFQLTKNLFVLMKRIIYLQVHGTAMGTRMAPSYANLFMGKLERKFLQTQNKIPQVWWRYIDNIFASRDHGKPSLTVFIDNIHRHYPTIKFTASWSAEEVSFLDTIVYLTNGKIGTDLHVKPTGTHQYLRMDSCHPQHCKSSIPYSQVLHFDEFVWMKNISRSAPANSANIY